MRKLYHPLLVMIICTLWFTSTQAQRKLERVHPAFAKPTISPGTVSQLGTTADCDSVNLATALANWSSTTYVFNGDSGFLNGTNYGLDKQKANYIDLSSTAYTYLTTVLVAFGAANSSVAANLSKNVYFRIYDGTSGSPGSLLGTEARALSQIKSDVDSGFISVIDFANAVTIPASKKFFVSVDVSEFSWLTDTVWVGGSRDDNFGGTFWNEADSLAWEQWGPFQGSTDTSWHPYTHYGPFPGDPNGAFNISLWIFPVVSTSATGCAALPVKLISFNAQRNNKDVTLDWQIADEFGMKGYEVERSDNSGSFKPVAFVAALNNAKNQSYSATDKNAFTISPTVQYRLKQIDGDGTVNYSRVITVKSTSSISDISFANPFNSVLKLQLNLATPQPVSAYLYDMQGKLVATEKMKMYNAASNTIIMASTANLQRGVYVLKVIAGTDQAVYKVVKQ